MRTIAVVNQKGGCGKTITAINLSAFLARAQRRVLLVDMDPQGHATLGLQKDGKQPDLTMYDVLSGDTGKGQARLRDIILPVFDHLHVAPSDILLSAVPQRLGAIFGRENRLAEALKEVEDDYDYVIVDCPPSVGLLTFNALKACSEAIIPVDPSFFSLHGIGKLLETLGVLTKKTGHEISVRALITLYTGRARFVKEVVEDIRKHLGDRSFDTIVRFSVKLAEAASHGLPITHYATRCVGFADYQALSKEVIQEEDRQRKPESALPEASAEMPLDTEGLEEVLAEPMVESEDIPSPSAPRVTEKGILFTLEAPDAEQVQLVGDFNDWTPQGNDMKRAGRIWRKLLPLPPGRYQYRYLVDGRWQSDPLNSQAEPSPYGEHNSIFVLQEKKFLR